MYQSNTVDFQDSPPEMKRKNVWRSDKIIKNGDDG